MDLPFDNIPLAPLYKTIVRWVKNYRSRYTRPAPRRHNILPKSPEELNKEGLTTFIVSPSEIWLPETDLNRQPSD